MDLQARVARKKRLHLATPVDRTAVPEPVDGAAQVPEQMVQERADIEAGEITGATAEIERQPSPPGRDGQPAADREAVAAVAMTQIRRLPSRCPGPADIGDEQKAALINEDEMGAPSGGVFLSGASRPASTGRWRPRRARRRGARASGNSSPAPSGPSRRGWGDTESRTPVDQFGHPSQGPEIRRVAGAQRALHQQAHELPFLGLGQPRRSARRRLGSQASLPIALICLPPPKHGTH